MTPVLLPVLFLAVALIYSMAGFGGGSSYIALLTLTGFPHDRVPAVALVCNLVVVSGGVYHFARARHLDLGLLWPFVLGSIPLAFVGGRLPLPRETFLLVLGVTLVAAGLLLVWRAGGKITADEVRPPRRAASIAMGAGLGLLSGMVGIGGGIFLAPLLLHLRWAPPKQVAAISAAFILVNSAAGLTGQLLKYPAALQGWDWALLLGAVLIGGQIGSRLGAWRIPQAGVRRITGAIVLVAGLRVLGDLVHLL